MAKFLSGPTYSRHLKPKKLIVMLHGYGDNADNFSHLVREIDENNWYAKYLVLNGPEPIPNYPMGKQWFDLYPNGKYIADAGAKEIKIVRKSVLSSVKKIKLTIKYHLSALKLNIRDCIVLGFSQGAMMTFELGINCNSTFGGLIIISGKIMEKKEICNQYLLKTPIFISHGVLDDVLTIDNFYSSVNYLKKNNCNFESHELQDDTHTISLKAINLLQKFIKKNI